MNLSSFVETIITNNITSVTNEVNIFDTIKISMNTDIDDGFSTSVIKDNSNTKIYHIYKNHLITENNIEPIKEIIDNNIYFFRDNYIYFLDKITNTIKLKRLIFNTSNNLTVNDNQFTILYDEFLENVYYFNILISCSECIQIFVNDSNNFLFLYLADIDYIVVLDLTNITENYILLPSNKNYNEIIVSNDKINSTQLSTIYGINSSLNYIDLYEINQDNYLINLIEHKQFNGDIKQNVLNDGHIYTLLKNNDLIINFNFTNKISNVEEMYLNNYYLSNNKLMLIHPNQISTLTFNKYQIKILNEYLIFRNLNNNIPVLIITNE